MQQKAKLHEQVDKLVIDLANKIQAHVQSTNEQHLRDLDENRLKDADACQARDVEYNMLIQSIKARKQNEEVLQAAQDLQVFIHQLRQMAVFAKDHKTYNPEQ